MIDFLFLITSFLKHWYLILLNKEMRNLKIENIILRQQLSNFKFKQKIKPKIKMKERIFWAFASKYIENWKELLIIVKPETVVKWHRNLFKFYWKIKCRGGRPKVNIEIRDLVMKMAQENNWGAPRIMSELIYLGFNVSEATVSRYMPKKFTNRKSTQTWQTFIHNHFDDIFAMDFFVIPTIHFRILYCFVLMNLKNREIVHMNVTYHPTQFWLCNQLKEVFFDRKPKYLIRDNDAIYGNILKTILKSEEIQDMPTSLKSPWQNGYCERVIRSIRAELLNQVIIVNEKQARKLLIEYKEYYNNHRPHLGLNRKTPYTRKKNYLGAVKSKSVLSGLHHIYYRITESYKTHDKLAA